MANKFHIAYGSNNNDIAREKSEINARIANVVSSRANALNRAAPIKCL